MLRQRTQELLYEANEDDLVLVTGSFFLVGELRKKWISEEYTLKHLKSY
jgi:folylpolyglutamate synthase/dihydropteroate synthase